MLALALPIGSRARARACAHRAGHVDAHARALARAVYHGAQSRRRLPALAISADNLRDRRHLVLTHRWCSEGLRPSLMSIGSRA
eukprot:12148309-Alexandrium_andersonii.AAC.1